MALGSKMGMALAAVVLSGVVYLFSKVPSVDTWFASNPVTKTLSTLVLAVVPAVIVALSSSTSWADVGAVALSSFLGALGIHSLLPAAKSA